MAYETELTPEEVAHQAKFEAAWDKDWDAAVPLSVTMAASPDGRHLGIVITRRVGAPLKISLPLDEGFGQGPVTALSFYRAFMRAGQACCIRLGLSRSDVFADPVPRPSNDA